MTTLPSSSKPTKATTVSAEELAQVLQIVIQARWAFVSIFKSTRRRTRRSARNTCRRRAGSAQMRRAKAVHALSCRVHKS